MAGSSSVGGIAGYNGCRMGVLGQIRTCYSVGRVTGSEDVVGIVGRNCGSVDLCFWDTETSGISDSYRGEGRITAKMQTATTFLEAAWDFVDETANGTEDIWWILEGHDYPRLWWELIVDN